MPFFANGLQCSRDAVRASESRQHKISARRAGWPSGLQRDSAVEGSSASPSLRIVKTEIVTRTRRGARTYVPVRRTVFRADTPATLSIGVSPCRSDVCTTTLDRVYQHCNNNVREPSSSSSITARAADARTSVCDYNRPRHTARHVYPGPRAFIS